MKIKCLFTFQHTIYNRAKTKTLDFLWRKNKMPNWCSNNATIVANSADAIKKMKEYKIMIDERKADKESDWDESKNLLFNSFVPRPKEEGNNWNTANWGTKWDADLYEITFDEENNSFCCYFMTAWCPPTVFYERMEDMGFEVAATYDEPGMGFFGKWGDYCDTNYKYDEVETSPLQDVIVCYNNEYIDEEIDIRNKKAGDLIWGEVYGGEPDEKAPKFLYIQDKEYSHNEVFSNVLDKWGEDLEICSHYQTGITEWNEREEPYIICELLPIGETDKVYGVKEGNTVYLLG